MKLFLPFRVIAYKISMQAKLAFWRMRSVGSAMLHS